MYTIKHCKGLATALFIFFLWLPKIFLLEFWEVWPSVLLLGHFIYHVAVFLLIQGNINTIHVLLCLLSCTWWLIFIYILFHIIHEYVFLCMYPTTGLLYVCEVFFLFTWLPSLGWDFINYCKYVESVLETKGNPNWICPVRHGICNCSIRRTKKGPFQLAMSIGKYKYYITYGFRSIITSSLLIWFLK